MKRRDRSRHFDFSGCEAQLPANCEERVTAIKQCSGLTGEGMAEALGVDSRQLLRWRRGATPSGGAMLSLARFAVQAPDGLSDLLGEQLTLTDEAEG